MSRHRGAAIFPSAWLAAKVGNYADKRIVPQAARIEVADRLGSGRHEAHEALRRDSSDQVQQVTVHELARAPRWVMAYVKVPLRAARVRALGEGEYDANARLLYLARRALSEAPARSLRSGDLPIILFNKVG